VDGGPGRAGSRTAQAKGRELAKLPFVERALTLADYVPDRQAEKRAILDTMAFLCRARRAARGAERRCPDRRARATRGGRSPPVRAEPAMRASTRARRACAMAARSPARRARSAPAPDPLAPPRAEQRRRSLAEQLDELTESLSPDSVTLETLAAGVARDDARRRWARARHRDSKKDLNVSANLEEFVDASPRWHRKGRARRRARRVGARHFGRDEQAMLASFVVTAVFLFLLWRNWWDTGLAVLPARAGGARHLRGAGGARLARRALTGHGALVHRGNALDDVTVGRDCVARPRPARSRSCAARATGRLRWGVATRLAQALASTVAAWRGRNESACALPGLRPSPPASSRRAP